jgi:hypothetical protein
MFVLSAFICVHLRPIAEFGLNTSGMTESGIGVIMNASWNKAQRHQEKTKVFIIFVP